MEKTISGAKRKTYKHLTKPDRDEIKHLLNRGYSLSKIAEMMGRSKCTISTEIKRNRRSTSSTVGHSGEYLPLVANHKAYARRKYAKYQGMKIVSNLELKEFVDQALLDLQSPEAIAGRLKTGRDGLPSVSRSAIEKYLQSVYGEVVRFEIEQLKKLFRRRQKHPRSAKLDGRKFIDERPAVIAQRERIGDLEVDFIVSGRGNSSGEPLDRSKRACLLTATDRKSRLSFIEKLCPVTIESLEAALVGIKQRYPELKSITTDNDVLFACHEHLEAVLGIPIYFCHPYSSWEKGSVENLNKYIRKFIRKGSNISSYSRALIERVQDKANRRFMGVIGYYTPLEFGMMEEVKTA